jgi:hypothetical protein
MLGSIDGFVSTGELRNIWKDGFIENGACACGSPFRKCAWWSEIIALAFGGMENVDATGLHDLQMAAATPAEFARLVLAPRSHLRTRWRVYLDALERLYRTLEKVSGAVVVDSSKHPAHAVLASLISGLDLRVVHLTRDPRAIAYSRLRHRLYQRYDPVRNALLWNALQVVVPLTAPTPVFRLRYEDLVADPRAWLGDILRFSGEGGRTPPIFGPDNSVALKVSHMPSGNPSRFRSGLVPLRLDDEWRAKLPARARTRMSALTAPLLWKYGYPLRARTANVKPIVK